MDCYKKLNAELIAEIRAMREQIAQYRKEVNETNSQLMYERCLRVKQKQYYLKILGENYRDMVGKIQSNIDLSITLDSNNSDCKDLSNANRILSHNRRSSKEILENLRNSNQWQSSRKRITISPILRSSDSTSFKEDTSDMFEKSDIVLKSPVTHNSRKNGNSSSTIEPKSQNDSMEMEESSVKVSDEDSYVNQEEYDAEDDNEIPEEECMTNLKTGLSQLNILDSIYEEECDNEEITARNSANLENKNLECQEAHPRNSYNRNSLRDLTNCEKLAVRTSPLDKGVSSSLPSPTCSFSSMSAQNFSCSTPCHSKETYSEMMTEFSQTNTNLRTREQCTTLEPQRERPKRTCKPNNLKEQSLRIKLRNESNHSVSKLKKKSQT